MSNNIDGSIYLKKNHTNQSQKSYCLKKKETFFSKSQKRIREIDPIEINMKKKQTEK